MSPSSSEDALSSFSGEVVIEMSAVVLAQMWDGDDHMNGEWWWVMGIGWLVFLALSEGGGLQRQGAEDVLAERFARGEIDEDEFRRRRDALRG
jgi:uncharacterized membrane protein